MTRLSIYFIHLGLLLAWTQLASAALTSSARFPNQNINPNVSLSFNGSGCRRPPGHSSRSSSHLPITVYEAVVSEDSRVRVTITAQYDVPKNDTFTIFINLFGEGKCPPPTSFYERTKPLKGAYFVLERDKAMRGVSLSHKVPPGTYCVQVGTNYVSDTSEGRVKGLPAYQILLVVSDYESKEIHPNAVALASRWSEENVRIKVVGVKTYPSPLYTFNCSDRAISEAIAAPLNTSMSRPSIDGVFEVRKDDILRQSECELSVFVCSKLESTVTLEVPIFPPMTAASLSPVSHTGVTHVAVPAVLGPLVALLFLGFLGVMFYRRKLSKQSSNGSSSRSQVRDWVDKYFKRSSSLPYSPPAQSPVPCNADRCHYVDSCQGDVPTMSSHLPRYGNVCLVNPLVGPGEIGTVPAGQRMNDDEAMNGDVAINGTEAMNSDEAINGDEAIPIEEEMADTGLTTYLSSKMSGYEVHPKLIRGHNPILLPLLPNAPHYFSEEDDTINSRMPPDPVATRWGSWYDCVVHHLPNMRIYGDFFIEEIAVVRMSNAPDSLKFLHALFANESEVAELRVYMSFVVEKCKPIRFYNKVFEARLPVVLEAFDGLEELTIYFESHRNAKPADYEDVINHQMPSASRAEREKMVNVFNEAFEMATDKLNKYTGSSQGPQRKFDGQPGLLFLQQVRLFSYKKVVLMSDDVRVYSAIPGFCSAVSASEMKAYILLAKEQTASGILATNHDFFRAHKEQLPVISRFAVPYLKAAISSADVERLFSLYRLILSDKRRSLSQAHINMLNFLSWNLREGAGA